MSLETFIARDLSVMEHNIQPIETEQNQDNDDNEQFQITERITTEDILGNISESDSSDDEDNKKQITSQIHQDISTNNEHHKHSKKRIKITHSQLTSTDAAALQLSEDEL